MNSFHLWIISSSWPATTTSCASKILYLHCLFYLPVLCVCAHECLCVLSHVYVMLLLKCWCTCSTVCVGVRGWLPEVHSFPLPWVLGIKLRLSGIPDKDFYFHHLHSPARHFYLFNIPKWRHHCRIKGLRRAKLSGNGNYVFKLL